MKTLLAISLFFATIIYATNNQNDSLKNQLERKLPDTVRLGVLETLLVAEKSNCPTQAIFHGLEALHFVKKIRFKTR